MEKYEHARKCINKLHTLSKINYYNDDWSVNHEILENKLSLQKKLKREIQKVFPNYR